jgi:hypothetical protein
VRAYKRYGFHSPLDVRWCHMSQHLNEASHSKSIFVLRLWHWLLGWRSRKDQTCTCGGPLPSLKEYRFSLVSTKTSDYFMGQCRRCRTIFWDAAVPTPEWVKEGIPGS